MTYSPEFRDRKPLAVALRTITGLGLALHASYITGDTVYHEVTHKEAHTFGVPDVDQSGDTGGIENASVAITECVFAVGILRSVRTRTQP